MTRRNVLLAAVVLIFAVQAVASLVFRREPFLPSPPPLADMPLHFDSWERLSEGVVTPETLTMLGPDDYIVRQYHDAGGSGQAELFIAYYKTQLRSKNAHDPKVCLPGAGWNPVESHLERVTVPGTGFSFPVNYYRIKKDGKEQVVVYWFQTLKGVYTFEQQLALHRIVDAIIDNRTDMALVRVVVPVTEKGVSAANSSAIQFAQSVYVAMAPFFPSTEKSGS
jgi:EpsI family protein